MHYFIPNQDILAWLEYKLDRNTSFVLMLQVCNDSFVIEKAQTRYANSSAKFRSTDWVHVLDTEIFWLKQKQIQSR